jgi:uncharacterized protein YdaU (DUF1376 family)
MPLYIGDYLADTRHLRPAEHGVYLLLIMHYWANGGLPNDDEQLRSIASCNCEEWPQIRRSIASFFHHGWHHRRIDHEIRKLEIAKAKRRLAGQKGGLKSGWKRRRSEVVPNRSNAEAFTSTISKPSFVTESERAGPRQEAASDEAERVKRPADLTRAEIDQRLANRRGK